MKKCSCTKYLLNSAPYFLGKHKSFKTDFTCPMCLHTKKKFASHAEEYHINQYFVCDYCHKYARKVDRFRNTVIKEFFSVLDYCVIMTADEVIVESPNSKPVILPFFIFENEEQLIKKVKTYILMS